MSICKWQSLPYARPSPGPIPRCNDLSGTRPLGRPRVLRAIRLAGTEIHLETATAARTWYAGHIAAVVAGDLAHQCQAEADAPVITLAQAGGTVKGLEDALP